MSIQIINLQLNKKGLPVSTFKRLSQINLSLASQAKVEPNQPFSCFASKG
jgi:hypothetical protein